MKNSIAAKLKQVPSNYLKVGFDPHKKKHVATIMQQDAVVRRKFKFVNSRNGFEEMLQLVELEREKAGADGVIFGIESGTHHWKALAYYLDQRGYEFRLLNPFTLKRNREGDDINRRKNDYRDAEAAAELLRTGKFVNSRLLYGNYAEIRATYNAYERLNTERSRNKNQLKGLLDQVFPEFTSVFKDICGKTAMAVLQTCAIPQYIINMSIDDFIAEVRKIFKGRALLVKKLLSLYEEAKTSTGIVAGAIGMAEEMALIVSRLKLNIEQTKQVIQRLIILVESIPESSYVLSIRGLSYITVAAIWAGLGPASNYTSAKQWVKMAGTNPTEKESAGKSSSFTPMSKHGRSSLRGGLWAAAVSVLCHNDDFKVWAKERQERPVNANPLHRREVIGAAINRLLHLMYALVTKKHMYQPSLPLMATVAS
jgi:transposase